MDNSWALLLLNLFVYLWYKNDIIIKMKVSLSYKNKKRRCSMFANETTLHVSFLWIHISIIIKGTMLIIWYANFDWNNFSTRTGFQKKIYLAQLFRILNHQCSSTLYLFGFLIILIFVSLMSPMLTKRVSSVLNYKPGNFDNY